MRALDAAAVTAWAASCVQGLEELRAEIDGINVYPVADSDTGSNLLATLTGARDALSADVGASGAGAALASLAQGAVTAAKGNSGVIVSQVLRGLADAAAGSERIDGAGLAKALVWADRAATDAVARPVEGTMLSVLHAVAAALDGSADDLVVVAEHAASAAASALAETPQQLSVLATAGVVDAGGRGLVVLLDALVAAVTGKALPAASAPATPVTTGRPSPAPRTWEVMYQLDGAHEHELPGLRTALSGIGDSVTVAGSGDGCHAVHVHCADIGAAIEAGIGVGTPRAVRVEPLVSEPPAEPVLARRAVVAVVRGQRLADLLRAEGISVLVVPADRSPSTEQLLGLIGDTAGAQVTVLAGAVDLTVAADAAAGHLLARDRDVVVVPCASPVQVLAALAVHDDARRAGDDVVAMAEAAAATRRAALLVAQEDSITWVGHAHAGDVLGFVDEEVVTIEPGPASPHTLLAAATTVLNTTLAAGGELVTVLTGLDAPSGLGADLAERLASDHPEVELVCYRSDQTDAVLLMGVE